MFAGLSKYEATRPDKFWSTTVPAHWQVMPGMAVLTENKARNTGLTESQVLSLSYGRVIMKPVEKQHGLVPDSYEGYQILEPGDIVIRPTDLQNDQRSIRVGRVRDRGIITSAYIGLRSKQRWTADYAYLYLTAVDSTKRIYGMGSGLRQQLGWSDLKRMSCLVPPVDEQVAIVKYLAYANARIDKAIAAKRRLLALLDERLQVQLDGIVSEAGGARVPFKSVVRLREGPGIMAADFRDSGVPLIRIAGMHGSEVDLSGCNHLDADMVRGRWERFRLAPGDFLLSASGSTGEIRPVGASAVGAVPYTGLIRLRPASDAIDMRFLALFVRSRAFADQIATMKTGVGIEHFGPTHLKRMWVHLPSLAIQKESVDRLEREREGASAIGGKTQREIQLLHEFRTRLVADVVTGQLDVREVAAALPTLDVEVTPADWAGDASEPMVDNVVGTSEV